MKNMDYFFDTQNILWISDVNVLRGTHNSAIINDASQYQAGKK